MSRRDTPVKAPVSRRDVAAALDAVYAQVPAIECRGDCSDTCTRFPTTPRERKRIAVEAGAELPEYREGTPRPLPPCPLLTWAGQCSVYEIRPLLCRLWGVSEIFPCNYGCRPTDGRLLGVKDTYRLIADTYEISGQYGRAISLRRILDIPDGQIAAKLPLMKAMAWGRISYDEASERADRMGLRP